MYDAINNEDGLSVGFIDSSFDPRAFAALERAVRKATTQFLAVNPSHFVPNILIIIDYDKYRSADDLREVLTGSSQGIRTRKGLLEEINEIDLHLYVNVSGDEPNNWIENKSFKKDVCLLLQL